MAMQIFGFVQETWGNQWNHRAVFIFVLLKLQTQQRPWLVSPDPSHERTGSGDETKRGPGHNMQCFSHDNKKHQTQWGGESEAVWQVLPSQWPWTQLHRQAIKQPSRHLLHEDRVEKELMNCLSLIPRPFWPGKERSARFFSASSSTGWKGVGPD